MKFKLGISRGTLNKRIGEEQQAQRDYAKNAAEARSKGATKTAEVITHIKREEHEHEGMLKGLKGNSMKHNPAPPTALADAKHTKLESNPTVSAERPLNQSGDSGMREHSLEAVGASVAMGSRQKKETA